MELKNFRVEYMENPIGLDTSRPRFSWQIGSAEQGVMQSAYRIVVTQEGEMVWDSGRVDADTSVLVEYAGPYLQASTRYPVHVEVWDNQGQHASTAGYFETGLMKGSNFQAQWISHPFPTEETAPPVFTKTFNLSKKIQQARIYASCLGIYEIAINGLKVGDRYFTPGWTNYNERLQYQTYPVEGMLEKENKIEITVGNGWYKGIFGFTCTPDHYGDQVAALAELHIDYTDGTKDVITTDETWKVATGPIRSSEIYMGETYDSCYEEGQLSQVVLASFDNNRLVAQENEPVQIIEKRSAQQRITTPKGEQVLDFGQILTGFVEFKVSGCKGQVITIRHAEVLDKEGNFYPETLRQAVSINRFICNGEEQTFRPHFTFHGFRYIAIEGLEVVQPEHFTACVLHSHLEETGSLKTSNPLVNQLVNNIRWSQKGNFLDIPTDCPQRDERLGWTGDAQVFAGTAAFNMNVASFFAKWLRDLASEQSEEYGVPHVVPNILGNQEGAAAWSDAAVIVPWVMYQTYGDLRLLEEQYDSMKGWIDYISLRCGANGLWQTGYQYGDWLGLDKEEFSNERTGATDIYLVANAYYAYSTELVAKTAKLLGKTTDVVRYEKLYSEIKQAFNAEYISSTGRLVSETQTACVLALHFNLAEEKYRERICKTLESNIAKHKNHLTTGFVGTPYLCHVLSDNDLHDLAGTLFLKEDFPSWLYAVKKGATTIWERWNSILPNGDFDTSGMNSLNHYAYGSIGEWMYRKLAGINQLEAGFKKILIKPQFIIGVTWVESAYQSVYGEIKSSWSCMAGKIVVRVTIPANSTAIIVLPEKAEHVEVGSGSYIFEYATQTSLERERYTMDSTLKEIVEEPAAVQMLNEHAPGMLDHPMIQYAYDLSLSEMLANAPAEMEQLFRTVCHTLNAGKL
ncbi:family 78 glycoside hydrolase catalytic domain [Paenibacillus sp. BIC5C1]|uniref:family 78 glycoside hydrolase catalytic domain n=1 Tax=Paenibacillus sp. BIC5C1 TaxID=3078263 RepID=UPI0028EF0782|nr:family 78 glycoside hydrolase catalytic domain [Paenibacillus sp. BIC5C1]